MNLDVRVDKDTCFYFWMQIVADWDHLHVSRRTYDYYSNNLSQKYRPILDRIKQILQESGKSRWILSDLYTGNLVLEEAKEIAVIATSLRDGFDPFWEEALPGLEETKSKLTRSALKKLDTPLQQIAYFLNSDFDTQKVHTLYLVQNIPGSRSWGLSIQRNNLTMVMPSRSSKCNQLSDSISVIAHEYLHQIEFNTVGCRGLFKESYDKYIEPHNIESPDAYSWKMMYIEAIVYCFASPKIGGYLSLELFNKERPTLSKEGHAIIKKVATGTFAPELALDWVGLNILTDVEEYISRNKKIDQKIADKMGKAFVDFYLTNQ